MPHHFFTRHYWAIRRLPVLLIAVTVCGLALGGCQKYSGGAMESRGAGGERVLFVYPGRAEQVCVVGTFNGWKHDQDCLAYRDGRWELEKLLASGRYGYGFFIDDARFQIDPEALMHEDDGFGRLNSVLIVD